MSLLPVSPPSPVPDRMLLRAVPGATKQKYLVCPGPHLNTSRLLVAVHGISRDAGSMLRALSEDARRHNSTVIAPVFDARTFPDYQRLGRAGRGARADLALNAIVEDAVRWLGLTGSHHLFGFSGGAQFAHRYVYAWPDRFRTVTLASAGWYTPFKSDRRFPNGTGRTSRLDDLHFNPRALASTPTHVLVGARDVARDAALRQTSNIDQQQGRNRRVRARWFYDELVAYSHSVAPDVVHRFTVLPNTNHDVVEAVIRGKLGRALFDYCNLYA